MTRPVLFIPILTWLITTSYAQDDQIRLSSTNNGEKISPKPTYLILAPRRVRPGEEVQLWVSVFRLPESPITIHAAIRRQGHEYASIAALFHSDSNKLIQMKMPENAVDGNYTLRIQGRPVQGGMGVLFENETDILFHAKRVSVFVQTSRPFYQKRSIIRFRVIAITPTMMPVRTGSINVYIKDERGRILRRWYGKHLFNGVYEDSFALGHPVIYGKNWQIEVEGWGYRYSRRFQTENNYPERFEVNVTMTPSIMDNEYGVGGLIMSNHSSGRLNQGNATVELEVRPPGKTDHFRSLTQTFPYFEGVTSFLFPLKDIQTLTPRLAGTDLVAKATVRDYYFLEGKDGTSPGKMATASSFIFDSGINIKFLGGDVRTFKPNVVFEVYVAVYNSDGTRFNHSRYRQVKIMTSIHTLGGELIQHKDKIMIIPDDSIVKYTLVPDQDAKMIVIKASYAGTALHFKQMTAYRHYTKHNKFISVSTSTNNPTVDKYMVFTVRTSVYIPEIYYAVSAGGRLLVANIVFMRSTQKTFSLALSRDMVPNARLVVYCISSEGEVLTDSIQFYVDGILSDGVNVQTNKGKDFNLNTAEVNAFADPGTYIAFSTMDYDLYRRGGNREGKAGNANVFFTQYTVEEELATYDDHANCSLKHTWYEDEARLQNVHIHSQSYAIDANTTFLFAGFVVFTDADLPRLPAAVYDCNHTLGQLACFDGSCYNHNQTCDGTRQCTDGADEMGCPTQADIVRPDEWLKFNRIWAHLDDADWAWKHFYTKPYGRIDFQVDVPSRPSTWLIGAFSLSQDRGLAFNNFPARLDSTKPFHMKVEMPKKAYRGEQLGVQLSLFNFWSQYLEILVTLHGSKDYEYIHVEDFGMVSSYSPRTTSGDVHLLVYVRAGESRFVHIPVLPVILGKVSIDISAVSNIGTRSFHKTITVVMDGVTISYHTPYFIDLVSYGALKIPDLEIPVREEFIHPELPYHLYVPQSAECDVTLVGDVIGPYPSYLEVKKIMAFFREGSGEQYMFQFVLNVYYLKFLKLTNQLSPRILDEGLAGLLKDLMMVYSYIKDDMYYQRRSSSSLPSTWLTAFALESLAAGIEPEWEHILYMDIQILNKMALKLGEHQNNITGAFSDVTPFIYDLKMQSTMTSSVGQSLNISITAYAAIAFAKAGPVLTGEAQGKAEDYKDLAAGYLAKHIHTLSDPFEVCLVTYALHVCNHKDKNLAYQIMRDIRRIGEYVYWSAEEIPPIPTEIVNTVPFLKSKPLPGLFESRAIQATAYALMVYLRHNRFSEATPIMKWIQTRRNSDSAFGGTQDSIVAVQALKEYGEAISNRELYNMLINLQSTSTADWQQTVSLHKGNFMQYFSSMIPNVYGSVKAAVSGTGLALLQMTTRVNVEHSFQIRQPNYRSFDLEVDKLFFSGRNSSNMYMNVCFRWARTDISARSGAVILTVDIPTGFAVLKRTVRTSAKLVSGVGRKRYSSQQVVLYLDYVESTRTCFEFHAERWYPVANVSIQHEIRLVDPYEPGFQNVTLYNTWNLFHNHICQVCGSFQCPYCPFYNQAPSSHGGYILPYPFVALIYFIYVWTCNK